LYDAPNHEEDGSHGQTIPDKFQRLHTFLRFSGQWDWFGESLKHSAIDYLSLPSPMSQNVGGKEPRVLAPPLSGNNWLDGYPTEAKIVD